MTAITCVDDVERRALARRSDLTGLDYLEVADDQQSLTVFFLGRAPGWITPAHLRIEGGQRIRGLRALSVTIARAREEHHDDRMVVVVDRPGDFSTYRLRVISLDAAGKPTDAAPADFDPRYVSLAFSFKAGCPSNLDCAVTPPCPEPARLAPPIDYLAKDYASFRRLIFDRLALVMPGWQERQVPDIGVAAVELLAYVGDYLSYHQDAVATEVYIETARRRASVRRHARLVDYRLHEGCSARAFVTVEVSEERLDLARDTFFFATDDAGQAQRVLRAAELSEATPSPFLVFEPVWTGDDVEVTFREAHNAIHFYTWRGAECCLPRGATCATLIDPGSASQPDPETPDDDCGPVSADPHRERTAVPPRPEDYRLALQPCDILVFEEVRGPRTGDPADADPARRHAVRLTGVERSRDPLTGQLLVEVCWAEVDALPFALCISTTGAPPDCAAIADVSVARGNVLLVEHGRRVADGLGQTPTLAVLSDCGDGCLPPEVAKVPGRFRPTLPRPGLAFTVPVPPCAADPASGRGCDTGRGATAARDMLRQDARAAVPAIRLSSIPAAPGGGAAFEPRDRVDSASLARALRAAESARARWLRDRLPAATLSALDRWDPARRPLPAALANALRAGMAELSRVWLPRPDLLASGPEDRHFAVEVEADGRAAIRFGDGDCGCRPDAGETFHADYRVGSGAVGNVGADTITRIAFLDALPNGADIRPRNPLPAAGGQDREPASVAKLRAPHLFRTRLERAVTAADYAAIVERDFPDRVQRAAATLVWTGLNPRIVVAVDARGRARAPAALLAEIERHLETYRRLGHDLNVAPARAVPLSVALHVCVRGDHVRGHVKAALLEVLGTRDLPDGRRGFFHPDALSFGQGVHLSRLVAAAQAVSGVESIAVARFERLFEGPNGELAAGVLRLGPLEVARLDNDPGRPENGQLTLTLGGGR